MDLTVHHVISLAFPEQMQAPVHSLRLFPSSCESQRTTGWSLSVEALPGAPGLAAGDDRAAEGDAVASSLGPGESPGRQARNGAVQLGAAFRDGAGDWTETLSARGPLAGLVITAAGRVETFDTSGILKGHREAVPPGHYLRQTRATDADVALTALAREVMGRMSGQSRLALAHALAAEVADRIAPESGGGVAGTTAAEVLGRGRGSARDLAQVLSALAHVAGLPARHVCGYLGRGGPSPAAAIHAWTEIFVDGFGWIGFDPASRCCPDERHVRLCSGLDAQDAEPLRGPAGAHSGVTAEVGVAAGPSGQ